MKKKKLTRAISMMLALLTASPAFVQTANAIQVAEDMRCVYLEERELAEDVLTGGNFYISSKDTTLAENSGNKYLLKVGRGGENLPATSVRVNLLDTTADYGEDYKVRVHDESVKIDSVSKSSVLEQIIEEGSSGTEYNATDVMVNGGVEASLEELKEAYTAALEEIENSEELTKEEKEAAINELFEAYCNSLDMLDMLTAEEVEDSGVKTESEDDAEASEETSDELTPAGLKAQIFGYEDNSMPMDSSGTTILAETVALTDMLDELYSFGANAGLTVDFAEGETEKYLEIIPLDNWKSDGTRMFTLYLLPAADNSYVDSEASIQFVIEDDEDPVMAKIGFSDLTYSAEDGFVRVTVVREDALNETVQVGFSTKDITAQNGVDYSKVDTTLVFPFGITERTLNIPVYTEGLEEMLEFKLFLSDPIGCEITNNTAYGQLYPDTGSYGLDAAAAAVEESAGVYSAGRLASSRAVNTGELQKKLEELRFTQEPLSTDDYFNLGVDDNHGEIYPSATGGMKMVVKTSFWSDSNGSGTSAYLASVPKETAVTPYAFIWNDTKVASETFILDGGVLYTGLTDCEYSLVTPAIFYRGYEITWKLESGRPSWPKVQFLNVTDTVSADSYEEQNKVFFQFRQYRDTVPNAFFRSKGLTYEPYHSSYPLYLGKWNYAYTELLYESEDERHNSLVENFFITSPVSYGLIFNVQQRHTSSKDPTLEIQKVRPIYRPFQIELREVEPLEFVDEYGVRRPSTEIPGMENANSVHISGDLDGDKTIVAYKDDKVTISVDQYNQYTYIKAIKLVRHGEEKEQLSSGEFMVGDSSAAVYNYTVIVDNLEPGTRSYTFSLDEELASRISGYDANDGALHDVITFESIGAEASSDGLKGLFDIEVELGYIPTTYEAVEHQHAALSVEPTYEENGKSVLHMGDYIRVYQSPREESADFMVTNTVLVETTKYSAGVPKIRPFFLIHEPNTNYISLFNEGYSNITFTANPVPKENQIVVKVPQSQIEYLDMNAGIFADAGEPEDRGNGYLYYTVVPEDELIVGQYYMLDAYPLDSESQVFWNIPALQKEFAQSELYYCADDTVEDNVIELEVRSAENNLPTYYLSFKANFLYEESTVLGSKGTSWIPARDVLVTVSSSAYGISNEFGELLMNPCVAYSEESMIRIRIEANGVVTYRDLSLASYIKESNEVYVSYSDAEGNLSNVKAYCVDLGTIEVSKYEINSPRIISIQAFTPDTADGQILIDNDLKTDFKVMVANDGSIYCDSDGTQRTENVTGVDILILDYYSNRVVYRIPLMKTGINNGTSEWKITTVLAKDAEGRLYKGGDKIYAQVTTDRVKGNGMVMDTDGSMMESEALAQTTYAPLDSGLCLAETGMVMEELQDVTLPFDNTAMIREFVELPFIGTFNALFAFPNYAFSMTQLPEGGIRISVGKVFLNDEERALGSVADDGVVYPKMPGAGLEKLKGSGFGSILHETSHLVTKAYAFRPMVAFYIDFGIVTVYDEKTADVRIGGLRVLGGGLMFGVVTSLRLVQYGMLGPIPGYLGLDVNLSVYIVLGPKVQYTFGEMPNDLFSEKEGVWDFNIVVQALLCLVGYAGTGLAGTLGIRGGAEANISAIWNPTVQRRYSEIEDTLGLLVNLAFKIWIDALLVTIPIPIVSGNFRFGYYNHPSVMSDAEFTEYMLEKEKELGLKEMAEKNDSDSGTYSLRNNADTENSISNAGISAKERVEASEWLPYGNVSAMSTYAPNEPTVLLEGGYENADPQLLVLDDETVLLAYLTDDSSRSDDDRTALMLAIYRDGIGWSNPVIVQTDDTADFEPDLCDAGENVLLSWISREPGDNTVANDVQYMSEQEIYAVIIPKSGLTYDKFQAGTFSVDQNSITKLSNDTFLGECYDYSPVGLYDDVSGDMVVYYLKTALKSDTEHIEAVNVTRNGSVIVYMLYDAEEQRWLTDKYFDTEYSDAEDRDFMVENMKGQRFLPAVEGFCENGINDPAIIDFDAISYNGLGVYTFTVDKDNNLDTSEDRELFIQFYNFESHKTYKVIRLTENNICESKPQLARTGGNTYLFWLSNNTDVCYINVSELVKNGINDDGTLKYIKGFQNDSTAADETLTLTDSTDGKPVLDYGMVYFTASLSEEETPALASFKPFVDENNRLYITWVQQVKDEAGNTSHAIYVSSHPDYSDTTQAIAWADPVAISELGMFQDQVAFVAYGDEKLLTVSNAFNMDMSESCVSDYFLVAVNYTTVGSMAVVDASMKTSLQNKDPMLNVAMEIRNTGMKDSMGYDLEAFLVVNDVESDSAVYTESSLNNDNEDNGTSYNRILPTHSVISSFSTALPATIKDGDKVAVRFYVKESGFEENEAEVYTSESVTILPKYDLSNVIISQQGDEYVISGSISNVGMVDGSNDSILVELDDRYNVSDADDKVYLSLPIGKLAKGQSTQMNASFRIPAEHLAYGYVNLLITPVREAEEKNISLGTAVEMIVSPASPVITVNGGTDTIRLNGKDSLELEAEYSGSKLKQGGIAQYTVADTGVAYVEDGKLIPVANGTTTLTVTIKPYGGLKKITVVVTDMEPLQPDEKEEEKEKDSSRPFIPTLYEVTVDCGEGGKVDTSDRFLIAYGSSRTIKITADEGFKVADVLVNGKSVGAVEKYTIKGASQNYTVSVVFEEIEG